MKRLHQTVPPIGTALLVILGSVMATGGCALYDDVSDPGSQVNIGDAGSNGDGGSTSDGPSGTGEDAELLPQQKTIGVGQRAQLTVRDVDGNQVDPSLVTWSSGDPNIASVDEQGRVLGQEPGTTLITAEWRGAELTAAVTVEIRIGSVEVEPSNPALELTQTQQMNAIVRDPQGAKLDVEVTWSTDDPKIASVDRQSGLVTAENEGETFVYATTKVGSAEGNTKVTVTESVARLETNPDEASLVVDESICIEATPYNNRDEELEEQTVSWTSNDDEIATVSTAETSKQGKVVATGAGDTTIVATSGSNDTEVPVSVSTWSDAASGFQFSCGATGSGRAYCWGLNADGQLGIDSTSNHVHPQPVVVDDLDPAPSFAEIAAGLEHACAVSDSGALYCWGNNNLQQLGLGNSGLSRATTPRAVSLSEKVRDLGAGGRHTCVVGEDGGTWCWGANGCGQVGGGSPQGCGESRIAVQPEPTAVQGGETFQEIATGARHTCGLTQQGEIYCWGKAADGQLGNGSAQGVTPDPDGDNDFFGTPQKIDVGNANLGDASSGPSTPFKDIAAGRFHTCAIDSKDRLWCWGKNNTSQAGPNCSEHTNDDDGYDLCSHPSHVPFDKTPAALYDGFSHMCLTTTSEETFCWGRGRAFEHGNGVTSNSATPVAVSTGSSTYTTIGSGGNHNCAVTPSGGMECWGANIKGQIGDGNSGDNAFAATPSAVVFSDACN